MKRLHRKGLFIWFAALTAFCMVQAAGVRAQDDPPAPVAKSTPDQKSEKRKQEAQVREEEAKARAAEADARAKEIKNKEEEAKLLAGSTSVNGTMIETDISGYKAAACAATEIGRQIRRQSGNIKVLVVYSRDTTDLVGNYIILMSSLDGLDKRYRAIFTRYEIAKRKLAGFTALGDSKAFEMADLGVPAFIVDWLSLFKTNVAITAVSVNIGREEFLSNVFKSLPLGEMKVVFPEKVVPVPRANQYKLIEKVNGLSTQRSNAQVATTEITKFLGSPAMKDAADKDDLAKELREIANDFKSLNKDVDRTFAAIRGEAPNDDAEAGGDNPAAHKQKKQQIGVTDFLRAEVIHDMLKSNPGAYWLDVGTPKSGSNTQNKNSPLIDIFTGGNRLTFSAGSIVSYRVFDSAGVMLLSDTVTTYRPYKKSKHVGEDVCLGTEPLKP